MTVPKYQQREIRTVRVLHEISKTPYLFRFIQLQDCRHVMEVENMDNLMMADQETIAIKTCPFCRKPIINTTRYKELINKTFAMEINPVKERVYGTTDKIKIRAQDLKDKLKGLQETHSQTFSGNFPVFFSLPRLRYYKLLKLNY